MLVFSVVIALGFGVAELPPVAITTQPLQGKRTDRSLASLVRVKADQHVLSATVDARGMVQLHCHDAPRRDPADPHVHPKRAERAP